jgi:BASS family bile acid:Na+ symporter
VGILAVLALVVVHNACAFSTGFFGAKLFGLPELDRRSMTIEVGIQNSGLSLAMLLNPRIFPPAEWGPSPEATGVCGGLILVAALWGVWHIIAGLSIASVFRRKDKAL